MKERPFEIPVAIRLNRHGQEHTPLKKRENRISATNQPSSVQLPTAPNICVVSNSTKRSEMRCRNTRCDRDRGVREFPDVSTGRTNAKRFRRRVFCTMRGREGREGEREGGREGGRKGDGCVPNSAAYTDYISGEV